MKKFKLAKITSLALSLALMCSFAMPTLAFAVNEGEGASELSGSVIVDNDGSSLPQSSAPTESTPESEALPEGSLPQNSLPSTSVPQSTSVIEQESVPESAPSEATANKSLPPANMASSTPPAAFVSPAENTDIDANMAEKSIIKAADTTITVPLYDAGDTINITGAALVSNDWVKLNELSKAFKLVVNTTTADVPLNAMRDNTAITNLSGIGIGTIGNSAFSDCTGLKSISLPEVTAIGTYSFTNTGIASLGAESLPKVTVIPARAFKTCTKLTSISLPMATTIGDAAFRDCTGLKSISLPEVAAIGTYSFMNTGIASLGAESLPKVTAIPESAFDNCKSLTSISLPRATTIGYSAFYNCTGLKSISLPEVTAIGPYSFMSTGITSLGAENLPKVTAIPDGAFSSCTDLTSISLPAITDIGNLAFPGCIRLTSISLPKVTNVDGYGFFLCTSLESISLPVATNIGVLAFADCTNLTSISLPAVAAIGDYAFYECTSLKSYIFGNTPPATIGTTAAQNTPANPIYYYTGTDAAFTSFTLDGANHLAANITRVNLNINPATISLARGGAQQHTAGQKSTTGVVITAPSQVVTWQLSGSLPIASAVDESGLVTISQLEQNPSLKLTANIKIASFEKVFTSEITVTNPYVAPNISTSALPNGKVGENYSQQLAATGAAPFTWGPESGTLPTGLSIAANGLLSGTPSVAGNYSFALKADNGGVPYATKTFSINIAAAPTAPAAAAKAPAVTKVKISQAKITLVAKKSYKPEVMVYTSDKSKDKLTWKTSNAKIAKVTASGKITAVKKGKAKITATASNGKKAVIAVTIVAKAVKNAKVKTVKASVPKSMKVKAIKDITGTYAPETVPNVKITYKSSNAKIASIDKAGRITAKKAGTVKITVKAGGVSKVYNVTVKK